MQTELLLQSKGIAKQQDSNYVMKGDAETRELNIYHLIFAPTYDCNLSCKHCYLPDHAKTTIPKDTALKIINEWSEIVLRERGKYGGIFHVKGGEPFVLPYLSEIIERLKELQSLRLMITTNGTIVDEGILQQLADCKDALDNHVLLIVSLDGATKETNSILRGKGNFKKTLTFLEKLKEYDIDFQLNCVLHKENLQEAEDYLALARKYGAKQVNFLYFLPRGNGTKFSSNQISHSQHFSCINNLYRKENKDTTRILTGSLPDICAQEDNISNECVAAYRGLLYVTPSGEVFPCPNTASPEFSMGSIYENSLKTILSKSNIIYEKLKKHSGSCSCSGEKALYKEMNDNKNLISLRNFSESVAAAFSDHLEPVSYCYNRNW